MTYKLHDIELRDPLFDWLEERTGKARIIEEKDIGRSRADAFMVTEEQLVGIEIKSDADTYERLARQTKDYDRYFDANMVVVGSRHTQAEKHVPAWWGIVTAEFTHGDIIFDVMRECGKSPKMNRKLKIGILWRPELAHILQVNGMPRYEGKSKEFVVGKIIDRVDPALLDRQICDELFERDYTTITEEIETYRHVHGRR